MNFYEVIFSLVMRGAEIGRVCVPISARCRFDAVLAAEGEVEGQYGPDTRSKLIEVNKIDAVEFEAPQAA